LRTCPSCLHQENDPAKFCSLCGAKISDTADLIPTDQTHKDRSFSGQILFPAPPSDTLTESLSLHLVDTGEIIPAAEKKEFVIGRNSEGQTNVPDIDLTPYDAYTAGVSRTHVYIKIDQSEITVRDLGSANGTRLNGHRIAAHTENKIKHGDILTLGTLKVQVFIQE